MSRRLGREIALQLLFRIDVGKANPEDCIKELNLDQNGHIAENTKQFAIELIRGVTNNLETIDLTIENSSIDWSLERMANVDRNALRIAVYEILFCQDIPSKASINEALELIKIYGDPSSVKFVNGVLGNIIQKL